MENTNLTVEQWIDGYGVAYTHQQVALEEINRKASLHYQNRGGATPTLDEHNLHQMKNWMALEDRHVPPIVLARGSRAYVIIDGNHRVAAAVELGRSKLDAYICDVKPQSELFDRMVLAGNSRNGKSLTEEEQFELAMVTAQLKGFRAAAQEHNISEIRLRTYANRKEGRSRYRKVFNADPSHLSPKVQEHLGRTDEENIAALGQDVIDQSRVMDLIPALRGIKDLSAAKQQAHAKELREQLQLVIADKGKPKESRVKRGQTVSGLVSQLTTITKTLQRNPTWATHPSLQEAVTALTREVKQ